MTQTSVIQNFTSTNQFFIFRNSATTQKKCSIQQTISYKFYSTKSKMMRIFFSMQSTSLLESFVNLGHLMSLRKYIKRLGTFKLRSSQFEFCAYNGFNCYPARIVSSFHSVLVVEVTGTRVRCGAGALQTGIRFCLLPSQRLSQYLIKRVRLLYRTLPPHSLFPWASRLPQTLRRSSAGFPESC